MSLGIARKITTFEHRRPFWPALLSASVLLAGCRSARVGPAGVALAPLAAPASASAVAIAPGGQLLAAVNPDSSSISLVDLSALTLWAEVPVGAGPRSLAFTPDGQRLLVANFDAGTLSVISLAAGRVQAELPVGARPFGVVAGSASAYVSLAGRPEIVVLDLARLSVTARVKVDPFPAGLALSRDQARLYITHLYSGRVTVLDTASLRPTAMAGLADPLASLSPSITLSPDGARAYLPRSRALADNASLVYSTTVQPVLGVLDLAGATPGLAPALELAQAGRAVDLPFAAAASPDGGRLYVANAGSDDVAVIDLKTGAVRASLAAGRNPRGLALAPDGTRLFVDNVLDGSLDVFDTASGNRVQTIALTHIPLAAEVLAGKRLYNSALAPMSAGNWLSCANCHFDGGADGRTWAGFPNGPRNTPALYGAAGTLPLHWNGDLPTLQAIEPTIRVIQGGAGLPAGPGGRSAALEALAAYLATLAPAASPYAPADDAQRAAVARGAEAFQRWGCAGCHAAPLYTDRLAHVSGFGEAALAGRQAGPLPRFDTPSLLGVWATAPYFHAGSAASLRDTFFSPGFHNVGPAMDAGEIDDMVAFLQSLP